MMEVSGLLRSIILGGNAMSGEDKFGQGVSAIFFVIVILLLVVWATATVVDRNRKYDCDSYGVTTLGGDVYSCSKKVKGSG